MSGPRPLSPEEVAITRRMAAEGHTSHAVVLALRAMGTRRGEGTIRGTSAWLDGRDEWLAMQAKERDEANAVVEAPVSPNAVRWLHPETRAAVSLPKLSFQPAGWENNSAAWWAA